MAKKEKRSKNLVRKSKGKNTEVQRGDSLDTLPPNSTLRIMLEQHNEWAKKSNAASKKLHNQHDFKVGTKSSYADRVQAELDNPNRRY